MELTFQVARRIAPSSPSGRHRLEVPSRGWAEPLRARRSDLDRGLALGSRPGSHALAALHEARRLGVETGQERRELLAGLLTRGPRSVRSNTFHFRRMGLTTSSWCRRRS